MLRNLVKKFKSQTLEGEDSMGSDQPVRKSPRRTSSPNTGTDSTVDHSINQNIKDHPITDRDSGTESDEEELEKIETISTLSVAAVSQTSDYYASSEHSLRSHSPTTSQLSWGASSENNSRDSMGCESGIGLRESDTDTPTPSQLLYLHNSQQTQLKQQLENTIVTRNGMAKRLALGRTEGAFRPVPKRQASLPDQTQTPLSQRDRACSSAGEKRKWSQMKQNEKSTSMFNFENYDSARFTFSGIDVSGDQLDPGGGRDRLMARRTPVKLLIAPPGLQTLPSSDESGAETLINGSNRVSPRKKCRPDTDELQLAELTIEPVSNCDRPSLNFDKMREKMMKPGNGRKKHQGFCSSKANLRGWSNGCLSGECIQADCMFRPVELPPDQAKTPTGEMAGYSSNSP